MPSAKMSHRVDYGVVCYQLPIEDLANAGKLENLTHRRIWCVRQRVLWLSEDFTRANRSAKTPVGPFGTSSIYVGVQWTRRLGQ